MSVSKGGLYSQNMIEIVNNSPFLVAFGKRPLRLITFIKVGSKAAKEVGHGNVGFTVALWKAREMFRKQ